MKPFLLGAPVGARKVILLSPALPRPPVGAGTVKERGRIPLPHGRGSDTLTWRRAAARTARRYRRRSPRSGWGFPVRLRPPSGPRERWGSLCRRKGRRSTTRRSRRSRRGRESWASAGSYLPAREALEAVGLHRSGRGGGGNAAELHLRRLETQPRVGERRQHLVQVRLINGQSDGQRQVPALLRDEEIAVAIELVIGGQVGGRLRPSSQAPPMPMPVLAEPGGLTNCFGR